MSSPLWFEWARMNLGTGATVTSFPLNFGPEGAGDGRFYPAASGERIPDCGPCQFQGYDENGLLRSLNGKLVGGHRVLCSTAEIACRGRQDFHLGHDSGFVIPVKSKIGQGVMTLGVTLNGTTDGVQLDGMKAEIKRTTLGKLTWKF